MTEILGLYAGIGGLELGFSETSFATSALADKDPHCRTVLAKRFPNAEIYGDVSEIERIPDGVSLVTAGFPCQNLSMAGDKAGLSGGKSSDISHLFDLLRRGARPTLVIENVYFMLYLHKGAAMRTLVSELETLGYKWAYRVVDTLAFGLPQRRRRVFLVASIDHDPRQVLFADNTVPAEKSTITIEDPVGFYWTEGRKGMGLAQDGIPPLKVASGLGIPSTPAVLFPDGQVLTPSIEACEELQGFPQGWTDLEFHERRSPRWSMVGNAVSVPAASWLAKRLERPGNILDLPSKKLLEDDPWPKAAWGSSGQRFSIGASDRPVSNLRRSIEEFRDKNWKPLSERALRGFLSRAHDGGLRFPTGFLDTLDSILKRYENAR